MGCFERLATPAWFSDDGVAELEIRSGGRSEEKEWKLPSPGESEARNPEWPVLNCLSPTCGMRIGPNSPSDEADSWLPLQDLNSAQLINDRSSMGGSRNIQAATLNRIVCTSQVDVSDGSLMDLCEIPSTE